MGCQRRHGVGETEAVGQEHVGALLAELLAVERLAQQHVAYPRLRRTDYHLVGIPRAAGYVPPAAVYPLLQLSILGRVVLLHPGILHGALEVEDVVGILPEQHEVLHHRVPDVTLDRCLYVPVPLGVQVGVSHQIDLFLLCLCTRCHKTSQSQYFHFHHILTIYYLPRMTLIIRIILLTTNDTNYTNYFFYEYPSFYELCLRYKFV